MVLVGGVEKAVYIGGCVLWGKWVLYWGWMGKPSAGVLYVHWFVRWVLGV